MSALTDAHPYLNTLIYGYTHLRSCVCCLSRPSALPAPGWVPHCPAAAGSGLLQARRPRASGPRAGSGKRFPSLGCSGLRGAGGTSGDTRRWCRVRGREFYFSFWVRPYPALAAAAPLGGRCRLQNHPRGFLPSSRWVFSLHPGYLGGLRAEERGQIQQMGQIRARGGFSSLTPFLSFFSAILAGAFPTGLAFPGACRAQPGEVREVQAGLAGVRGMLPAAPRPEPGGGARWERSPWQPPAPAPSSRSSSGVALYFPAPCFSSSLFLLEEKTL